jgi:hypothetical protein
MSLRRRLVGRLVGLGTRWGLLGHPYGEGYAKERYTHTGGRASTEPAGPNVRGGESAGQWGRARIAAATLLVLLASVLSMGLLVGVP